MILEKNMRKCFIKNELEVGICQIGLINMSETLLAFITELEKGSLCLLNPKNQFNVLLITCIHKPERNNIRICLFLYIVYTRCS